MSQNQKKNLKLAFVIVAFMSNIYSIFPLFVEYGRFFSITPAIISVTLFVLSLYIYFKK